MFTLKISTGGSAYRDVFYGDEFPDPSNAELIRNLRQVIEKLQDGVTEGVIMDINGNKTGEFRLEG